jgi:hypothetical protein
MGQEEIAMNGKRAFVASLGLSVVMLIATGFLVALASAQTGGGANQIAIRSQDTNTGQIVVDTVIAAQDGWLVVYSDTTFSAASVVGWVPVRKGVNTNLKVDVNNELVESTPVLWAVLHVDRGVIGLLELPMIDGTVQENGQTVMVAFGTQAPPAEVAVPTPQPAPAVVSAPTPSASVARPQTLPAAGASQTMSWLWLMIAGGMACAMGALLLRWQVQGRAR